MPYSPLHKLKQKKNLAVLAALIAWIVVIFFVTLVKTGMGH